VKLQEHVRVCTNYRKEIKDKTEEIDLLKKSRLNFFFEMQQLLADIEEKARYCNSDIEYLATTALGLLESYVPPSTESKGG